MDGVGYARPRLDGEWRGDRVRMHSPTAGGGERDRAPRFPEGALRSVTAGSQGVQTPLDQAMPGDPQSRAHQGCRGPTLPWAG